MESQGLGGKKSNSSLLLNLEPKGLRSSAGKPLHRQLPSAQLHVEQQNGMQGGLTFTHKGASCPSKKPPHVSHRRLWELATASRGH